MGAPTAPVAPGIALSGVGRPVFVDLSGRRTRWLSRLAKLVGWCVVAYIALVAASLSRAPWAPRLSLPGLGPVVPQLTQASPPRLGAGAVLTSPPGGPAATARPATTGGSVPPVTGPPAQGPAGATSPAPGHASAPASGQSQSPASGQSQSPASGQSQSPGASASTSPATTGNGQPNPGASASTPPATTGNGQPNPAASGNAPPATTGNGQPNPSQASIHRQGSASVGSSHH